jgi:hypothetical protein
LRTSNNRSDGCSELSKKREIKRVDWLATETERERSGPVVGGHRDVPRLEKHGPRILLRLRSTVNPNPQKPEKPVS